MKIKDLKNLLNFGGNYNDLTNKPSVPTDTQIAIWNSKLIFTYTEATIAATTASNSAALALTEFPNTTDPTAFPLVLPASYRIYVAIGTTVASGLHVTAVGGTY